MHWKRLWPFGLTVIGLLLPLALACTSAEPTPAPTQPPATQPTQPAAPTATARPAPTATQPAAPTAQPVATPTAQAQPTAAPTQPVAGKPTGKVVMAIGDVGPINYELFVLVWPYNDRNQWLGIQDTVWYTELENGNQVLKPSVASSWELKGDGLVLKIRQDIPWHDPALGKLTVDDVLHSWERATAEGTKWTRAEEFRTNYKVAEMKALDSETIFLPWNKRNLKWFTIPRDVTIQSKKLFDQYGADYVNTHPMGTGPFKVKEHVSDDHLYLEAVAPHWRETPKIAEFHVLEVPEEATRIAMLKTGEADSIQFGIQNLKEVKSIPGAKIWNGPTLGRGGFQIAPTGQYYQKTDEFGNPTNRVPLVELWPPALPVDDPPPVGLADFVAQHPDFPLAFATTGQVSECLHQLDDFRRRAGIVWQAGHVWVHRSAPIVGAGTHDDAEDVLRYYVRAAAAAGAFVGQAVAVAIVVEHAVGKAGQTQNKERREQRNRCPKGPTP